MKNLDTPLKRSGFAMLLCGIGLLTTSLLFWSSNRANGRLIYTDNTLGFIPSQTKGQMVVVDQYYWSIDGPCAQGTAAHELKEHDDLAAKIEYGLIAQKIRDRTQKNLQKHNLLHNVKRDKSTGLIADTANYKDFPLRHKRLGVREGVIREAVDAHSYWFENTKRKISDPIFQDQLHLALRIYNLSPKTKARIMEDCVTATALQRQVIEKKTRHRFEKWFKDHKPVVIIGLLLTIIGFIISIASHWTWLLYDRTFGKLIRWIRTGT